jgi:hypothetical protein
MFDCHPGRDALTSLAVEEGSPTASAVRGGAGWVVTLTFADGRSYRYQVRRLATGYCVFRGPSPDFFVKSAGASP